MSIIRYVTGKTKLLGVIGNPISHSISPELHNTLSNYMGIDAVYVPFKVEREKLGDAVRGLKALNFKGFNITIPHKSNVIEYLDELSREASFIGAVNTVKIIENKLYGYNTDVDGFVNSFKEEAGTGFTNKKVAIIGAGGAARAIAIGVANEGAQKIFIINRTLSKAIQIRDIIISNIMPYKECPENIESFQLNDSACTEVLKLADIIINTTSIGMHPDIDCMPVPEHVEFNSNQIVYDAIYNPSKTKFLQQAENKGCKIINGLGMLIYQGIKAYEIWMDITVPKEIAREIFNEFKNYLT
ncbi:MAG TPA: shikimate dehydrogenase [Clostridiaceae bacterium]|nr:shikimate dehydrogenase [Clostridiaceae bacterium]